MMNGFFDAGSKVAKYAALTTMFVVSGFGFTSCKSSAAEGQEAWKQEKYKTTAVVTSGRLSSAEAQENWKQTRIKQAAAAKLTPGK